MVIVVFEDDRLVPEDAIDWYAELTDEERSLLAEMRESSTT